MTTYAKKDGRIVKIQENGETVWKDEDYIQRPKIGEKTAQMLRDVENIQEVKEFLAQVLDVELNKQSLEE